MLARSRVNKINDDYEKVPLPHPGRMKTGAAFNQHYDYTPSVSNVKGILQKKCRKNPYFFPQDELFMSDPALFEVAVG